ncbi:APC family permease [Candidatus Poribacteria bacterium]
MRRGFERSLGFLSVFSISVGAMISGLFVLPGLAAAKTGPSVILAFFLAGLIALPAALSKTELATAIPTSGGTYIYLDRSMGPFIGTVGGIGTWFSLFFKSAFALVGLGAYLALLFPLPTKYAALAFCVGLIVINIAGVKKTAKLQIGIVICVLAALALLTGRGFTRLQSQFFSPFITHGWMGVITATGFVFISYAGVTKIASIAEEVRDPERNIPLGIIISLVVMIFVYAAVVFVIIGTVPLDALESDLTPVATSARAIFGAIGLSIWSVVAVLALLSMANAGILSASRFPFAMSRDRLMPDFLNHVHPKLRTPYSSILLTGGFMLLLIAFVDVESLVKLASAFQILVYSLENLSLIIFRESKSEWYRPSFRSPLYPWMQLVGIGALLLLLLKLGSLPMIGVAGIFLFGAMWYFIYARNRIDRTGALAQTQRRIELLKEESSTIHKGHKEREILVVFFGNETEAEIEDRIRVSLLFSLPDGFVRPVYFDEAPDQTIFDTLRDLEDEAFFPRFQRATNEWSGQLTLDSIATHDAKLALFSHARELGARWILMGWQKKSFWDVLIKAHRYWWLHHAPCNVAQLINRGLTNVRRIAVMAEPGPYDALLIHIADRLSMEPNVEVFCLHVADEDAPNADIESVRVYHNHLAQLSARNMESRIIRANKRLERILIETKDCVVAC